MKILIFYPGVRYPKGIGSFNQTDTAPGFFYVSNMPNKPKKPCPGKGPRYRNCPNLIKGPETCCSECKPYEKKAIRKYDKARDETPGRKFLHSTVWRRIRGLKLSRDPLCERCGEQNLIVPATLVHHIDGNELNNHPINHESLCNSCHLAVHSNIAFGNDKRK